MNNLKQILPGKSVLGTLILLLFTFVARAQNTTLFPGMLAELNVNAVSRPVISLNGIWKIGADRKPIQVPGEMAMQGFSVKHDIPVLYYKEIQVPDDYKRCRTILRFDGVYSYARLWVNGKYICDHHGGFTRWEADITDVVVPGKRAEVKLEVTDCFDEISYAAGYAKHIIGGVLRDVTLYALPENHIGKFYIETDFDKEYKDATLKLKITSQSKKKLDLKIRLEDTTGRNVLADGETITLLTSAQDTEASIAVPAPVKWDAEHPVLYKLQVDVYDSGKKSYSFTRKVGFRKVEVEKNIFKVNGHPVKLRGACWHNIHPTLGRVSTLEYELKDIELAKKANINFFRTSHYAPSERFVELCDEHGIYIEAESAACFVNINRPSLYGLGKTESDSAYTDRYIGQLQEMVDALRNSPSVLFWSIGNENRYGTNFQLSYDWVKKEDKTRPVIFSFPGTVPGDKKIYDLLSAHYPTVTGDVTNQHGLIVQGFRSPDMPVIFDEMAHVACYTNNTLRADPNIRAFWGESLDKMWTNMFNTPDVMGGAIWCMLDETFMMPSNLDGFGQWWGVAYPSEHLPVEYKGPVVGYGEWGIVDVWRREKPEFWATKKAFSPVKLLATAIEEYVPGVAVAIPVQNRFDHTNLDEVTLRYRYKGTEYRQNCPFLEPHRKGILLLEARQWMEGDVVQMDFFRKEELVDSYLVTLGSANPDCMQTLKSDGKLEVKESDDRLFITGTGFTIPFNLKTGLIDGATIGKDTIIVAGPYFHLDASGYEIGSVGWQFQSMDYKVMDENVLVSVSGNSNGKQVLYFVKIQGNGVLDIVCDLPDITADRIREAGLQFIVSPEIDRLQWKRKGYFSCYPSGDLGALSGDIPLYVESSLIYREKPKHEWGEDDRNFYYYGLGHETGGSGRLTMRAKSMKENIYMYALKKGGRTLQILSDEASVACRINNDEKKDQIWLYVNKLWDYPEIGWGNYYKRLNLAPSSQTYRLVLSGG